MRNLNIEGLRVIMILAIIIMHLSGEYFNLDILSSGGWNYKTSIIYGLRSLCFLGVSTFAFISGYYGISIKDLLKKIISFQFIAWFYGFLAIIIEIIYGNFKISELLIFVFPIASNRCWYFSAYMLLMILSPLIKNGVDRLTKEDFTIMVFFTIFICYVSSFLLHSLSTDFITLFSIYLIGRYVNLYPPHFYKKTILDF